MAIDNETCVSFGNQPKEKFGYLTRVTPVCRCLHWFCGWNNLATSRESKAHFGIPWVRPWDNRGKCHMDEKRIQCLSNASQHRLYPSIFNRFWDIASYWSKIATFSYPTSVYRPRMGSEFREDLDIHKTRMDGLSCGEESMTICSVLFIQYQRGTDGQTDRRTDRRTDVQLIAKTCFSIADARKNHFGPTALFLQQTKCTYFMYLSVCINLSSHNAVYR